MWLARGRQKQNNASEYMNKLIRKAKLEKLATYVLINSINLHNDSIELFHLGRYSSAFYLSVIAMEEMGKAKWLEHYWFYYIRNPDYAFEQKFFLGLYDHKRKQNFFIGRDFTEYSPKYYDTVVTSKLEQKKLASLYVGLTRNKKSVDTHSRISTPARIKETDAKQQISLLNSELKRMTKMAPDRFFDIAWMDAILCDEEVKRIVNSWKFKSGLKSEKWWHNHWIKIYPPKPVKSQLPTQALKELMIKVIQLKEHKRKAKK